MRQRQLFSENKTDRRHDGSSDIFVVYLRDRNAIQKELNTLIISNPSSRGVDILLMRHSTFYCLRQVRPNMRIRIWVAIAPPASLTSSSFPRPSTVWGVFS